MVLAASISGWTQIGRLARPIALITQLNFSINYTITELLEDVPTVMQHTAVDAFWLEPVRNPASGRARYGHHPAISHACPSVREGPSGFTIRRQHLSCLSQWVRAGNVIDRNPVAREVDSDAFGPARQPRPLSLNTRLLPGKAVRTAYCCRC